MRILSLASLHLITDVSVGAIAHACENVRESAIALLSALPGSADALQRFWRSRRCRLRVCMRGAPSRVSVSGPTRDLSAVPTALFGACCSPQLVFLELSKCSSVTDVAIADLALHCAVPPLSNL
jgi:hypothetical protein